MDTNSTPTEPLPTLAATAPIPVSKSKRFSAGYRFVVIGLLLVATVVLGTFTARWIMDSQVEKVFPVAPTVAAASECGLEPTVTIPETEGVTYKEVRSGDRLTVRAIPESERYELAGGADALWEINMASEPCPEPTPESTTDSPETPVEAAPDHVGDVIDGAKDVGSEVWDWTKEYGPGIWDRVKELGNGAKESIEEWSQGGSE